MSKQQLVEILTHSPNYPFQESTYIFSGTLRNHLYLGSSISPSLFSVPSIYSVSVSAENSLKTSPVQDSLELCFLKSGPEVTSITVNWSACYNATQKPPNLIIQNPQKLGLGTYILKQAPKWCYLHTTAYSWKKSAEFWIMRVSQPTQYSITISNM